MPGAEVWICLTECDGKATYHGFVLSRDQAKAWVMARQGAGSQVNKLGDKEMEVEVSPVSFVRAIKLRRIAQWARLTKGG